MRAPSPCHPLPICAFTCSSGEASRHGLQTLRGVTSVSMTAAPDNLGWASSGTRARGRAQRRAPLGSPGLAARLERYLRPALLHRPVERRAAPPPAVRRASSVRCSRQRLRSPPSPLAAPAVPRRCTSHFRVSPLGGRPRRGRTGGVAAQFIFRFPTGTPAAAGDSAFSRAAWLAMIAARFSSDVPKCLRSPRSFAGPSTT
jgi:hypothetical protein